MAMTKKYPEVFQVRFEAGVLAALDDVLKPGESRADAVREAAWMLIVRRTLKRSWKPVDPEGAAPPGYVEESKE